MLGVAAAAVACDFAMTVFWLDPLLRGAVALSAFAALVYLANGDLDSLGLRGRPKQGWARWIRLSLLISLLVAACLVAGFGIWHLLGRAIPFRATRPEWIWPFFLTMCFVAPVIEEAIYRVVFCAALVPVAGCWPAIVVSGFVFAALHVVYGVTSLENLVGGFFLAWAYLKSETLLMPVLLHSIGNAIALAGQIAGWYWLQGMILS